MKSLKENFSSRGHLKLCDKVLHEPISVGFRREPEVTLALDVDLDSLRLEQRYILSSNCMLANVVICGREESNGNFRDQRHVHEGSCLLTAEPVVCKLLEAILDAVHLPVLLRLDGNTLASILFGVGANETSNFSANGVLVIFPVGTVESVDTMILKNHNLVVECQFSPVGDFRIEARGEHHCLVNILCVESLFKLSKTVVHLDGALRVADIENFVDTRFSFDGLDVGDVVVQSHLCPGEVPVRRV